MHTNNDDIINAATNTIKKNTDLESGIFTYKKSFTTSKYSGVYTNNPVNGINNIPTVQQIITEIRLTPFQNEHFIINYHQNI